jgi:RNA polymerase sigma-70 factor (ECF subfamily)
MSEPASDLIEALRKLSPKQRAAVVLHHVGGYSAAEIASILGSTRAAVKVHLSQGRKRLRMILEEDDE